MLPAVAWRRCYLQVEGAQQPGRLEDLAQQRVGQSLLHALQHRVAAGAGLHVQLAQHRLEAILERRPAEAAQHLSITNRSATRTLFRWLFLAHFCSFFLRFFAVFSVLTPGIQKVAPKDPGPVAQRSKTAAKRVVAAVL